MAKRRRVGNLLALAVLGTVAERPMHPYEMASVLRARGKDQDMDVKWGSLYTVVRNLEKHELIEAAETSRQGSRPQRTIYRITDAGRAELLDWVRELLSVPEPEHRPFVAGLSLIMVLPPDEVTGLLRARLDRLSDELDTRRNELAEAGADLPRLFLLETEYDLAVLETQANWVRALLDDLTSGSLPDLEPWRHWHQTGATPPNWEELAQRGATEN